MNPIDYLTAAFDPAKDTIKRALGQRLNPPLRRWAYTKRQGKQRPPKYEIVLNDHRYTIYEASPGFIASVEPGYTVSDGKEVYIDANGNETLTSMSAGYTSNTDLALARVSAHLYKFT